MEPNILTLLKDKRLKTRFWLDPDGHKNQRLLLENLYARVPTKRLTTNYYRPFTDYIATPKIIIVQQ